VRCDDGRVLHSSHAVLAIGSVPNTDGLGLEDVGVQLDGGYVVINRHCQSSVPHIYAAGDMSGKLPLSSVASMQGRKVAEHVMGLQKVAHRHLDYDKAASAIFTEPEIADVGLAEADAFAVGRKIRVTKVPFSSTPKALINNDWRGFVKIISDPATGVVLGGSIVGRHAAELISVIALAVTANLKVTDIVESSARAPGAVRGARRSSRLMFSVRRHDSAGPIVPAGHHLASFGRRAGGLIIDQLLVSGPPLGVASALGTHPMKRSRTDAICVVQRRQSSRWPLVYETLAVWRWGRTVGKLGDRHASGRHRARWRPLGFVPLVPTVAGAHHRER
jgi:hypothetical protein